MKANFGAVVVSGSGKLSGHSFQGSGSRAVMRVKGTPINPNSYSQTRFRQIRSTASRAWHSLTEAQRNAWNESANKPGTGYALFSKVRYWQMTAAATLITTPKPQVVIYTGQIQFLSIVKSINRVVARVTQTVFSTGRLIYYLSRQRTSADLAPQRELIYIDRSQVNILVEHQLYTAYTKRFGELQVGAYISCMVVFVDRASGKAKTIGVINSKVLA